MNEVSPTPPRDTTSAGRIIAVIRETAGLTQRELADLADVSPAHLSRVERGLRKGTPRWQSKVTEALGRHLAATMERLREQA